MADNNQTSIAQSGIGPDPFTLLRRMTSEFDGQFDDWPFFGWPVFESRSLERVSWSPKIEVVEKNNRLVTRVDLPGVKKEDVTVEVTDGWLTLFGERKRETEEKKDNYYRSEREYGSFYRTVPLPDGVKSEDVKASFADGVLEVSVPLPAKAETTVTKVKIEEPAKAVKTAA